MCGHPACVVVDYNNGVSHMMPIYALCHAKILTEPSYSFTTMEHESVGDFGEKVCDGVLDSKQEMLMISSSSSLNLCYELHNSQAVAIRSERFHSTGSPSPTIIHVCINH